jgi:hypothetical protein
LQRFVRKPASGASRTRRCSFWYDRTEQGTNHGADAGAHGTESQYSGNARVRLVAAADLTAHWEFGAGEDAEQPADHHPREGAHPHVMRASFGRGEPSDRARRCERCDGILWQRPERRLGWGRLAKEWPSADEQRNDESLHDMGVDLGLVLLETAERRDVSSAPGLVCNPSEQGE